MVFVEKEDLEWIFKQARDWWFNTLGHDVKNIEKLSKLEKKYKLSK